MGSRGDKRVLEANGRAMPGPILGPILGIETSCDETAAAVVTREGDILSNIVMSQIEEHRPYGGVVPEIAARAHVEVIDDLVARAMAQAGLDYADLSAVAATAGPGLIGGVLVGLMTGKALALAAGRPFIAVNHLEGHALSVRLTEDVAFPYLMLLVSGGHCQLLVVQGVGRYRRLGTTIDDALGEAFDKTAKILGLGYPGGPLVERAAAGGHAARFSLPRPMLGRAGCDFSFSGLKTAVRRAYESLGTAVTDQDRADICAAFQAAAGDVVADRVAHALAIFMEDYPAAPCTLVVAGGVAANSYIRARLEAAADAAGFTLKAPPPALCTDNGAMIAWAGMERLALGLTDPLSTPARARWPLDPGAAPAPGAGVKA
jgi:N6-L-threonylcarbamoyladenine synthase